jgi:hypothetical protein
LSPDTSTSTDSSADTSASTADHEHAHKHDHMPTIEKSLHINDTHHANKHVSSSDTSLAPISTSSFYSIKGQHERWRNPKFRFMVYNIVLLACGWALGEGAFFIQVSTTSLAATSYTNNYKLATIPIGLMLLHCVGMRIYTTIIIVFLYVHML